jgi:hypothetical protein
MQIQQPTIKSEFLIMRKFTKHNKHILMQQFQHLSKILGSLSTFADKNRIPQASKILELGNPTKIWKNKRRNQ